MAESEDEFGVNGSTTSFSQLLFSQEQVMGLDHHQSNCNNFNYSDQKSQKVLCFGKQSQCEEMLFGQRENANVMTNQKSGVTCIDSNSSPSSVNNSTLPKSDRKRKNQIESPTLKTPQRRGKRSKAENPTTTTGHAKVRKEKLGERITALQQLVSPFGKTDTASVLHEAMGYIKFLHDQVQVLCSPYLQHSPDGGDQSKAGLRSKGLCLVPAACTIHMANSNGADFWSSVMGHTIVSSTKEKW